MLAWPLLGQVLSPTQAAGIVLTCGGIAWVIAERMPGDRSGRIDTPGLLFAVGAAVCQAVAALMSRHVFDQVDYGAAPSAVVRIAAGTAVVVFLLPLDKFLAGPGRHGTHPPVRPKRMATWCTLAVAILLGTVMAIWLQQTAFKLSENVGVASTLLSTSPLFVLPLAAPTGERVSWRAVTGAAVGAVGIAVLLGVGG